MAHPFTNITKSLTLFVVGHHCGCSLLVLGEVPTAHDRCFSLSSLCRYFSVGMVTWVCPIWPMLRKRKPLWTMQTEKNISDGDSEQNFSCMSSSIDYCERSCWTQSHTWETLYYNWSWRPFSWSPCQFLFAGCPPLAAVLEKRLQLRVIIWPSCWLLMHLVSSLIILNLQVLAIPSFCLSWNLLKPEVTSKIKCGAFWVVQLRWSQLF
jgi:hypothetical protein